MVEESDKYATSIERDYPMITLNSRYAMRIISFVREWGTLNRPYEENINSFIADKEMWRAINAVYWIVKYLDGHLNYSQPEFRDASNPYTLERKKKRVMGKPNPPATWNALQRMLYYWTMPYAADKINRPSQSHKLGKDGMAAGPFKGGLMIIDDFAAAFLDEPAKEALKEAIRQRSLDNLEKGIINHGGPSQQYSDLCEKTAEARGVNMGRTTRTNRNVGIYAKMTTEQDVALSGMLNRAAFRENKSKQECGEIAIDFIRNNCVDKAKLEAAEKERNELAGVYMAVRAVASQKAYADKLAAQIKAIDERAALTPEMVIALVGPATAAAIKSIAAEPDRLE